LLVADGSLLVVPRAGHLVRRWCLRLCRWRRRGAGMRRRIGLRGWFGSAGRAGVRGSEGPEGDLEGVDHLAGAAGVDGVLGEAVDDGGEGDEDGGSVLDGRNFHAGDFGIDEEVAIVTFGLEVMVVAIIFAFECGRAATLAGWGLIVVAVVVAGEVWSGLRRGVPSLGIDSCIIFQTNHLAIVDFAKS